MRQIFDDFCLQCIERAICGRFIYFWLEVTATSSINVALPALVFYVWVAKRPPKWYKDILIRLSKHAASTLGLNRPPFWPCSRFFDSSLGLSSRIAVDGCFHSSEGLHKDPNDGG